MRGELHARELELQRAYEELGHVRDELRALHSENAVLRVDMRLDTRCLVEDALSLVVFSGVIWMLAERSFALGERNPLQGEMERSRMRDGEDLGYSGHPLTIRKPYPKFAAGNVPMTLTTTW